MDLSEVVNSKFNRILKSQNGTSSIYRLTTYKVANFNDPILSIFGETLCGLKFILCVDCFKELSFSANDTYDNCMMMRPNYKLDLSSIDINYKNIVKVTQFFHICNWYYSTEAHETKREQNLFQKFASKSYSVNKYNINLN